MAFLIEEPTEQPTQPTQGRFVIEEPEVTPVPEAGLPAATMFTPQAGASTLGVVRDKIVAGQPVFGVPELDADVELKRRAGNALAMSAGMGVPVAQAFQLHDELLMNIKGQTPNASLMDQVQGSLTAGLGDVYSNISSSMKWLGLEGDTQQAYERYGSQLQAAYVPPMDMSEFTYKKFLDPEFWATSMTRQVPFTLSLIPAAIAGAYVGTTTAGAIGLGAFGKVVLGSIGGATLSRSFESASEAGNARDEAIARGMTEDEADSVADQVFKDNLKLIGLDAAQFAAAFMPIARVGKIAQKAASSRVLAASGRYAGIAASEGGEERFQEASTLQALGDDVSFFDFGNARLNEATAIGSVFGVALGGAGSVWTMLHDVTVSQLTPEQKATYTAARDAAIESGAEDVRADAAGLDAVAETPEGEAVITQTMDRLMEMSTSTTELPPMGEPVIEQPADITEQDIESIATDETDIDRFLVDSGIATPEEIATAKAEPQEVVDTTEQDVELIQQVLPSAKVEALDMDTAFALFTEAAQQPGARGEAIPARAYVATLQDGSQIVVGRGGTIRILDPEAIAAQQPGVSTPEQIAAIAAQIRSEAITPRGMSAEIGERTLIALSEGADIGVAGEEVIESVLKRRATAAELTALVREIAPQRAADVTESNAQARLGEFIEDISRDYADYVRTGQTTKAKKTLYDKLKAFIEQLLNLVRGTRGSIGRPMREQFFEQVRTGEVFGREGAAGVGETFNLDLNLPIDTALIGKSIKTVGLTQNMQYASFILPDGSWLAGKEVDGAIHRDVVNRIQKGMTVADYMGKTHAVRIATTAVEGGPLNLEIMDGVTPDQANQIFRLSQRTGSKPYVEIYGKSHVYGVVRNMGHLEWMVTQAQDAGNDTQVSTFSIAPIKSNDAGEPTFIPKDILTNILEVVELGEAGQRIFDPVEGGFLMATQSTFPEFMRGKWGKKEVVSALKKAIAGKPLTNNQTGIVESALEYGAEMFFMAYKASKGSFIDYTEFYSSEEIAEIIETGMNEFSDKIKINIERAAAAREVKLFKVEYVKGLRQKLKEVSKASKESRAQAIKEVKQIFNERIAAMNEQQRQKVRTLAQRRRRVRAVQDELGISNAVMRQLMRNKDVGNMSDYEYAQLLEDIWTKSVELTETQQAKAELIDTIQRKRLQGIANLRKTMRLPTINNMTAEQMREFEAAIEPFWEGDSLISQRMLETVDNTDLEGVRTWREVLNRLSEETGAPLSELVNIRVGEFEKFQPDTQLAEKNPFYRMMVQSAHKALMNAEAKYYAIEQEFNALLTKAHESVKRPLKQRALGLDPLIFEYMESDNKAEVATRMTPEQLDVANFMAAYYITADEYLKIMEAYENGLENYITHMRKGFLEAATDHGIWAAFKSMYREHQQSQDVFRILAGDTGRILPMVKHFKFAMHRTGGLAPTNNIARAFLGYAKTFESKKALDSIIPKLAIYAQSLTPQQYTPRGLEVDRSLKQFVYEWVNNKKGRRSDLGGLAPVGGTLDVTIRAMRTFTTLLDLGFNIATGVASSVGEQMMNFNALGAKQIAKGTARALTAKGRRIAKKYEFFIGKHIWDELKEPGKPLTEGLMQGMFSLFRESSILANEQWLLGTMTDAEWESETISDDRLADMRIDMGRWRVIEGGKSIFGSTSIGGAAMQYKSWAVAPVRTILKDISKVTSDLAKKPIGEAISTREAAELRRIISMAGLVLILGSMFDREDKTFAGQLRAKVYREALTSIQAIDGALWFSAPRILSFMLDLSKNIKALFKGEEYTRGKYRGENKGARGLKNQLTPRLIKQFIPKEDARKGR